MATNPRSERQSRKNNSWTGISRRSPESVGVGEAVNLSEYSRQWLAVIIDFLLGIESAVHVGAQSNSKPGLHALAQCSALLAVI
jgi:hypothetical protein